MRIIKKKDYFYLRHSFRKNGKVITVERYLGKHIPNDIGKIRQDVKAESLKSLYSKFECIRNNFQEEWKRTPESARQREKEEIAIAFTYNTNAIEGSTITLEETREIIIDNIAPKKPLRDIKETEAHCKVFLSMLDECNKLSRESLLEWHKAVFGETKPDIAGRYRDFFVRVGPYLAPDWQDVETLMAEFFRSLKCRLNPVELAARAHYKFEKAHPFGDGNGRIGRLLMNHILWSNGYPMLIIEYSKRRSYYSALQRDEDGFVNYFFRRYLAVHRKKCAL